MAERSDVINWMYDLQLGRRNLTEKEKSYYRAKQYNSLKKEWGGDRGNQYTEKKTTPRLSVRQDEKTSPSILPKGHIDPLAKPPSNKDSTAQKIAKKTGVSEKNHQA